MLNGVRGRRSRSQQGFSLLEVMVALSILAVSFVVLLGLLNRDILQNQETEYITRATLLAQHKISEVEMSGFPDIGVSSGDFPDEDGLFRWTQTVNMTLLDFAREVEVEVRWKEDEDYGSVGLITYVTGQKE